MARHGNGSAIDYLTVQDPTTAFVAIVDAPPWSVSLWFQPDDLVADYGMWRVHDPDGVTNHIGFGVLTTGALRCVANSGGVIASGTTTNTIAAGSWHHACLVVASATDRRIYLDGDTANKGSSVTSKSPTNMAHTDIGAAYMTAAGEGVVGRYAENAVWNIELSEAEVVILAKRVDPRFVRLDNMIAYVPCLRNTGENEPDLISGNLWLPTDVGVTDADHVNVIHLSMVSRHAVAGAVAAAATRRRHRGDRVFGSALRALTGRESLRSAVYDERRILRRPPWQI